jgi:4-amino-4-deoxy-L-arabinose transferase-like glycosyltransferase
MELPVVPFAAALLYKAFGFSAYSARAVTLVAFLVMMLYVYKLTKRELGVLPALISCFAAGVLPLYHPFGKLLFTEPSMIALSVVSLYHIAQWIDYERRGDWIFALVALSLTIALKLESLYLFLPVAWIAFRKYRWEVRRYKELVVLVLSALILPVLWYGYAYYIHAFQFPLVSHNGREGGQRDSWRPVRCLPVFNWACFSGMVAESRFVFLLFSRRGSVFCIDRRREH